MFILLCIISPGWAVAAEHGSKEYEIIHMFLNDYLDAIISFPTDNVIV